MARNPLSWQFAYGMSAFLNAIDLIIAKRRRMTTERSIQARLAINELVTRCFTFFHLWCTTYNTMEFPIRFPMSTTNKANTKNAFATSDGPLDSSVLLLKLTAVVNVSLLNCNKMNEWIHIKVIRINKHKTIFLDFVLNGVWWISAVNCKTKRY